jgi:DNA-directed RNA polymerase subunit RPC12/RpoP
MSEYECIECGIQFEVELLNGEDDDQVSFCPVCSTKLEDDLQYDMEEVFE